MGKWYKKALHILTAFFCIMIFLPESIIASEAAWNGELFQAIKKGAVEDVRSLVKKKGIDINAKNNNDMTALLLAVREGNNEILQTYRSAVVSQPFYRKSLVFHSAPNRYRQAFFCCRQMSFF